MTRLSIVTIVRNHKDGFLRTAASVAPAKPDWCEWIVIDGASTDGTAEAAAEHYGDRMDWFVSELDGGIAAAFNKGIAQCRGDYVLFLNAGDVLTDPSFTTLERVLRGNEGAPLVVGRIRFGAKLVGRPVSFRRQLMRNFLPHQAMLVGRSLFETLGPYDAGLAFGMDYEWSLRLKDVWDSIRFDPAIIADMETGGASVSNYRQVFQAYVAARQKHFGFSLWSILVSYFYIAKAAIGRALRRAIALMPGRS